MKFTLEINLGNEAMQTGNDVAEALQGIVDRLVDTYDLSADMRGKLRDSNGNTVGHWEINEPEVYV